MANFADNTTQLQNLLVKVNKLPEAGSGSGSVETGTLYGTSSRLVAPTSTIYYNLEGIPNISSKKLITLLQPAYTHSIVLSRSNTSEDFVVSYILKNTTVITYEVTISENVMTIVAENVPSTLDYFAI